VLSYKPSPIQQYQNHFYTPMPSGRSHLHKLCYSKASWTNTVTIEKLNICCRPGSEQSLAKFEPDEIGMVIKDLEHILAFQKYFVV